MNNNNNLLSQCLWVSLSVIQSFLEGCSEVYTGAACIARLNWGRVLIQAHAHGCWQVFRFSLTIGQKPPSVPCHLNPPWGTLQHGSLLFLEQASKRAREQEREMTRRTQVTSTFNLLLEVMSHHIRCILFVRSKSRGPMYTSERGLRKSMNTGELGEGHRQPF